MKKLELMSKEELLLEVIKFQGKIITELLNKIEDKKQFPMLKEPSYNSVK